jgi:hypothetical protein
VRERRVCAPLHNKTKSELKFYLREKEVEEDFGA